ncbi:MAG: hypothetical protein M3268_04450 [Acidobacteriota bacterium]|nr:hypothetical protein [Acidobacteriota bacterium]
MRTRPLPSHSRRLLFVFALAPALWIAAAPPQARAQSAKIERDSALLKSETEREMEMRVRDGEAGTRGPVTPQMRLALEQIGEDFRQMQIVNNEMMRAAFPKNAKPALDYARISKATAEINRRASRLKTNLQLPSPSDDDARGDDQEIAGERELRSSLLALDDLIMGFVNNPTFRKQGVIDARHSARASRDLTAIIRLSRQIRQRAEKLKG